MSIEPGIHPGMSMADYLADPCPSPSLSSSTAHRLLTRSPLHAWQSHPRLGGATTESGVADKGSVAHDLLLGGEGKIAVIDPNDYPAKNGNIPEGWTNQAIREARDKAREAGLTPILAEAMSAIREQVAAAREFIAKSELAGVFDNGEPEQTIVWQEGDIWCRARPDWLARDLSVMLHFKTSETSVRPEPFIRGVMSSMGYGLAMQFYARGLIAVSSAGAKTTHVILCQEQEAPYACSLIGLTPAKVAIENARVERAIKVWQECMKTQAWPGYDGRIHWAEPTAWELADAEAQQP